MCLRVCLRAVSLLVLEEEGVAVSMMKGVKIREEHGARRWVVLCCDGIGDSTKAVERSAGAWCTRLVCTSARAVLESIYVSVSCKCTL